MLLARPHPGAPPGQQHGPATGQVDLGRRVGERRLALQDDALFPVAVLRQVVVKPEKPRVGAQHVTNFGRGPNVEFTLHTFAVGILGGREGAFFPHVAQRPGHGLAGPGGVKRVAGFGMNQCQQVEDQGVVVQHLLEMRDQPGGVGGIAGVAAAEMVVDAALAHPVQHKIDRRGGAGVAGSESFLPEQPEDRRVGEFRGLAEAAALPVDVAKERGAGRVQRRRAGWLARPRRRVGCQRLAHRGHRGADLLALVVPGRAQAQQHLGEARPAEPRRRRKIGAAPERRAFGRQHHGQRPAALLAHGVQGRHVDLVDVGPFLAVDLDADEAGVHDFRHRLVLEAFMRHDVAPMAGGVADREQDRQVAGLGLGQCRRSPDPPVHRVVPVLPQIGRGGRAQHIRHVALPVPCEGPYISQPNQE